MSFGALLARCDSSARSILGGDVTYTPSVGAPVTVSGIFDALYVKVDAGEVGVSSAGPAVFLRLSELPTSPEEDTAAWVTVDGQQYSVREVQPDGQGGVLLLLHEV